MGALLPTVSAVLFLFPTVSFGAEPVFKAPEDVPIGVELLANGGLEMPCPLDPPPDSKTFKHWHFLWPPCYNFYPRRNGGNIAIDPEVSLEGSNSLRLDPVFLGDNGFVLAHKASIPARAGDVFHASVYVRVEGGFASYWTLTVNFQIDTGAGEKTEGVTATPPRVLPGQDEWRKIELTAEAPPNAKGISSVAFKVSNTTVAGRCWWDAMSLRKLRGAEAEKTAPASAK